MKRKIVRHGPSSLTISLPIKWAKQNNLQAGDEIDVLEDGSSLMVSGKGKPVSKEITIDVKEPLMKRMLFLPFVQGYDQIRYNYNSVKAMHFIENTIEYMYGFEIIKHKPDNLLVKNVTTINENEYSNMTHRLFHVACDMFDLLLRHMTEFDEEVLVQMKSLKKSMVRIDLYCRRLINLESFHKTNNGSRYAIVRIVETLGDILLDMAEAVVREKEYTKGNNRWTMAVLKGLYKNFEILKKMYLSKKLKLLLEFRKYEHEVWHKMKKEYTKVPHCLLVMNLWNLDSYMHNLSEEIYFDLK